MAFTNLLTAMFPVGSIYLSTISISPSSTIGGTWVQVKGATLAATGDNSFASEASYGGNLAITEAQMPSHRHRTNDEKVLINVNPDGDADRLPYALGGSGVVKQGALYTTYVGGGKTICLTTGAATFGIEPLNFLLGGGLIG